MQSHRITTREIESATESGNDSYRFVQSKLRNIEPVHAMGMVGNFRDRWFRLHDVSLAKAESSMERQHRQQAGD